MSDKVQIYTIGENTMREVFSSHGLTDVSDWQRVMDCAEKAFSALLADRDRLQRENDNLRQIERNVQAVREQEHQRANAAEADRDRLAAEVARLTADLSLWIGRAEVAEAQRQSADDALVDKYRKPGSGVFKFPSDVAAIVMRLDAADAEVARLREALDEMVDAASDRAARYSDMDDMDSEASAANLIAKDLSEIRGKAHAARRGGEA